MPEISFRGMPNTDLAGSLIGEVKAALRMIARAPAPKMAHAGPILQYVESHVLPEGRCTLRTLGPDDERSQERDLPPPSRVPRSHGPVSPQAIPGRSVPTELAGSLRGLRGGLPRQRQLRRFFLHQGGAGLPMFDSAGEYSNDDSADSGAKRRRQLNYCSTSFGEQGNRQG